MRQTSSLLILLVLLSYCNCYHYYTDPTNAEAHELANVDAVISEGEGYERMWHISIKYDVDCTYYYHMQLLLLLLLTLVARELLVPEKFRTAVTKGLRHEG